MNEYGSQVAYQVRFEGNKTNRTRVLFLTEGLLLRQYAMDNMLSMYDVIVVDEVHERHMMGIREKYKSIIPMLFTQFKLRRRFPISAIEKNFSGTQGFARSIDECNN